MNKFRLNMMKLLKAPLLILSIFSLFVFVQSSAFARTLDYDGGEAPIFVNPGEPTQVSFPSEIKSGYRKKGSKITLQRQGNFIILFARRGLSPDGEVIIVHLDDKRSYSLRILPAGSGEEYQRDDSVTINDLREPDIESLDVPPDPRTEPQIGTNAPTTTVNGLTREMVLRAEFGKRGNIPGYVSSNKYSGETVLDDGVVEAKIDEMFLGSNLWGYVLSVENTLDTQQKINPATFRIDGTMAVSAKDWDLAPRPETAEQKIAGKHKTKIYIVTKSKRR